MAKNTRSLHESTVRLTTVAMLAALCAALSFLSVDLGNFKFSFSGFPIIVAGFLFGIPDGMAVGLVGALIEQIVRYGIDVTTALWVLPAVARGLFIGVFAQVFGKRLRYFHVVAIAAASGVLVTILNTGVMYLDSVIKGYYSYAYVFGALLPRFVSGIITSGVFGAVTPLLVSPLTRFLGARALIGDVLAAKKKPSGEESETATQENPEENPKE